MLKVITLLLICFPLIILSSYCDDFVTQTIPKSKNKSKKDLAALTEQEYAFLKFTSTKSSVSNFQGDRTACDKSPVMKYFVAVADTRIGNDRRKEQGHGVCLPIECDNEEDIYDQHLIKKIFTWKKWFMTKKTVKLMLYDPLKSKAPKGPAFYFVSFIFLSLIALSIAATYVAYKARKQANLLPLRPENQQLINKNIHWIYQAFDLRTNIVSLYQTSKEQKLNENLSIFSFLRVITSFWVIYYHTQYNLSKTSTNPVYMDIFRKKAPAWYSLWFAGDMSVEYFFVMTGFLSAYTLIPKLGKGKFGIGAFLTIIKHRFIRIWPALMLGFAFWWLIVPQLFHGPMWFKYEYKVGFCDQLWWTKALLIDNITNYYYYSQAGNYCMIITWYIPTEFQIYFVAVLALAVYARYRKIGFVLIFGLIIQSLWMAIHNVTARRLSYPTLNDNGLWHFFRMTPFTRWYTLFIGVLWGILYYEYTKLQKKNIFYVFEKKPIVSYISIILGIALNILVIFYPVWTWNKTLKTMWYPLRILFISIAMTMVFMPLASNRDFYLKRFFNLRIFQVMGKYSYMTYLFSDAFVYVFAFVNTTVIGKYTTSTMLIFTMKVFFAGQVVAIIAHLILEKPLLGIEGYLSKPKASPVPKKASQPMQDNKEEEMHFLESKANITDLTARKVQ